MPALREWLTAAEGAVFRGIDRHSHVSTISHHDSIGTILKRAAVQAGIVAGRVKGTRPKLESGFERKPSRILEPGLVVFECRAFPVLAHPSPQPSHQLRPANLASNARFSLQRTAGYVDSSFRTASLACMQAMSTIHLNCASEYEVLRPPAASFVRTLFLMRSSMSRRAVSCEHLASLAHFEDVSLPSKPFNSL